MNGGRQGIERVERPNGIEDEVIVKDVNGENEMPLRESEYRKRGYNPPCDKLPWRK